VLKKRRDLILKAGREGCRVVMEDKGEEEEKEDKEND